MNAPDLQAQIAYKCYSVLSSIVALENTARRHPELIDCAVLQEAARHLSGVLARVREFDHADA